MKSIAVSTRRNFLKLIGATALIPYIPEQSRYFVERPKYLTYMVFEDLPLDNYGERVPNLSVIIKDFGKRFDIPVDLSGLDEKVSGYII